GKDAWHGRDPGGDPHIVVAGISPKGSGLFTCRIRVPSEGYLFIEPAKLQDTAFVASPFKSPPDAFRCRSYAADGETEFDSDPEIAGGPLNDRDVRFLATADPQIYHSDVADEARKAETYNRAARATLSAMNDWLEDPNRKLRGALIAGDLTQNTRLDEWLEYRKLIVSLPNPTPPPLPPGLYPGTEDLYVPSPAGTINRLWYETIGNHDVEPYTSTDCHFATDRCKDPEAINREILLRGRAAVRSGSGPLKAYGPGENPDLSYTGGLYSWDWHDVHFVNAGEVAVHGSLKFLKEDLAANVGRSDRPVVIMQHYGFDSFSTGDWGKKLGAAWTPAQRRDLWDALKPYNVVAFITGHIHSLPEADWEWPFWNPALYPEDPPPKDCQPTAKEPVGGALERACIPAYVAGAARFHPSTEEQRKTGERGAFISVRISNSDSRCTDSPPKWGEACMVVQRNRVFVDGGRVSENIGNIDDARFARNSAQDRQVIHVPAADKERPAADPAHAAGNSSGWHTSDVVVTWNWSDGQSGIDESACTTQTTSSGEGAAVTVTARCKDRVGNEGTASRTFKVDKTAPAAAPTFQAATAGWYREDVAVAWNWSDEGSGVDPAACTTESKSSGEGAAVTVTATCKDKAGNMATASRTFKVDKTPPAIKLASRPQATGYGWHNSDVTIRWECADDLSGAVDGTVSKTLGTEGSGQSLEGTCTDKAGNTASNTQTDINIDKTPPGIVLLSRPPANANGWHNSDVTITWSCADALSGVVSETVSDVVSTDGSGQSAKGTCTDKAGNTASNTQSAINLDKTKPSIQIASPPDMGTFDLEQVVTTSYDCADESTGSGLASCDGDVANGEPADTADAGQHTFSVVARDNADNESSRTVTYTVLKAPTSLAAEPLLLELDYSSLVVTVGRVSARLTYGPVAKPAAGRTVVFTAASERLCTATTGSDGTATCTFGLTSTLRAALSLGYSVTFVGDHNLLPSTAKGSAAAILGWGVAG
ncbi:MAG TPA: hypothetical protein VNU26_05065, partial [Mycobacteriales bacterium]|nr:hypothetical protein [Mycobacteriales bacterium]